MNRRFRPIFASIAFLALCGLCSAASSQKPVPVKSSVSPRQRFAIHPNDITIGANQAQTFGLTDAKGKTIPVRWKISGVGCSPAACGTIDSNGNYQAPQSLHQPLVVMLEGIPMSDAEYPAFARIQLSPTAPAAPVTPVSMAAQAPGNPAESSATNEPAPPQVTVTYRNGQLTIDAANETLANVLRLVSQKIGATINVPFGGGTDRIVVHAGPGTASAVLTQLLKGSHFNFVMIGSPQRPAELQQVLLTIRNEDGTNPSSAIATASPEPVPGPAPVSPVAATTASMTGAERLAYLRSTGFGRFAHGQMPQDNSPDQSAQQPDPSTPPAPDPSAPQDLGDAMKEKAREIREGSPSGTQPPAQQETQPQ
jgi:hypothetical protein